MVAQRKNNGPEKKPQPPAKTPEDQEHRLINLAFSLAEKQLAKGDASAQVLTHFLKAGSGRESLERERLRNENELLKAKVAEMANQESQEKMYAEALNAMRTYAGHETNEEEYEDEY